MEILFVCHIKLHVLLYVMFVILQFMEIEEESIARSKNNQSQLLSVLQEKLRDFSLTKNESKIYIFLSRKGAQKAIEISRSEKIPRTEVYHLLSNLEAKGIVLPSIQKPTRFSAVDIEDAIDSIIENQEKKIEELKILKNDMIDLWRAFQSLSGYTKSEISRFELAMKKYAKSEQLRKDFQNNIKKLKQSSDFLDN